MVDAGFDVRDLIMAKVEGREIREGVEFFGDEGDYPIGEVKMSGLVAFGMA